MSTTHQKFNVAATRKTLASALRQLLVHTLCFSMLWGGTLPMPHAQASTYSEGNKRYMSGDFKGAEAALRQALPRTKAPKEKAKVHKLLGICEYMQNKKGPAAGNFKAALRLDPTTKISPDEVLDESIIGYFNAQRGGAKPAATAGAKPAPAAAAAVRTPIAGKAAKTTSLLVKSNVPTASINIDGIFAGMVGNRIEADPGKMQLEVSAKGYITARINTKIHPNTENTIEVTLKKIPPPKPKVVPKSPAAVAGNAKDGIPLPDPGVDLFNDKDANVDPSLASRDLASEFAVDGSAAAYGMQGPAIAKPQQAPVQQPPMMQQPQYQQPMYQQPAPMYAPPAPMYAAPPVYQAPVYQQPVPYYQPPYQAPYQAPYTPPAPVAAPAPVGAPPPPDYYGGADEPDIGGDPVANSIKRQRTSKKKPKKKSGGGSSSSGGNSTLIALLPFGAGQFQNKNYILGLAFAAAEGGALFLWYDSNNKANQVAAEAQQVANADSSQFEGGEEAQQQFIATAQSYINKMNSQAKLGLMAFGALWAAGVAEAFINMPSPKSTKKSKRKRRLSLDLQDRSMPHYASYLPSSMEEAEAEANWGLNIVVDSENPQIQPGAGISLKLNF